MKPISLRLLRSIYALSAWCLLCTTASAEIVSTHRQVIDFTQPEKAAEMATWSDTKRLGCTKEGFGWEGDKDTSIDGWIETQPLAIGTGWRPTTNALVRVKIETNYPAVVATGPNSKIFYTPGIYVRFSADRVHWSDWQPTKLGEVQGDAGKVLYTTKVGVPYRASAAYREKFQQWSRRDDIAWGSDEDEFCRWLVKQEPDYFEKERPFVGYVQFLIEDSFKGSQRLRRFEADVSWGVGGIHTFPKDPAAAKKKEALDAWSFRGVEEKTGQTE